MSILQNYLNFKLAYRIIVNLIIWLCESWEYDDVY